MPQAAQTTHIMESRNPSTPNPMSPGSIVAQLLWFGGNAKSTLLLQSRFHGELPFVFDE
jgi:hypothetical protein